VAVFPVSSTTYSGHAVQNRDNSGGITVQGTVWWQYSICTADMLFSTRKTKKLCVAVLPDFQIQNSEEMQHSTRKSLVTVQHTTVTPLSAKKP
jgi:hypothetical protein